MPRSARAELSLWDRTYMLCYSDRMRRRTVCCFFSSRRRHTRSDRDWSSDVCSSDLMIRHTRSDRDWSSEVCSSDQKRRAYNRNTVTNQLVAVTLITKPEMTTWT